jgi:hypothetical protein
MASDPNSGGGSGFGKRGHVNLPPHGQQSHVEPAPPPPQSFGRPKASGWMIGGLIAAGLALLMMVGSAISGTGLLAGLLGGLLAKKLFGGSTPTTATAKPGTTAATAPAVKPGGETVSRGGFGSTGESTSSAA